MPGWPRELRRSLLQNLFQRRNPPVYLDQPIVAQGQHSLVDRLLLHDVGAVPVHDHAADMGSDRHDLVKPLAAPVARTVAVIASLTLVELYLRGLLGGISAASKISASYVVSARQVVQIRRTSR